MSASRSAETFRRIFWGLWMSLAKGCQAALRSGVQYWRLRPIFGYEKLSRAFFAEFKGPNFSSKKRHDHDGFSESKGVNPTWPAGL